MNRTSGIAVVLRFFFFFNKIGFLLSAFGVTLSGNSTARFPRMYFHLCGAIYRLPVAMAEQLKLEGAFFGEMHPVMLYSTSASEDSKVMNDCLKLHFPLCLSANMNIIYP